MENTIATYDLLIREHHLDFYGHVNNATYLQIYEEARWEFISANGYDLEKIKSTGKGPIVLELKLRFLKELLLREKITIHTQTVEYTSRVGTIKQWITNSKGELCSDLELKIGLFDTRTRKLVQPTEAWMKALQ